MISPPLADPHLADALRIGRMLGALSAISDSAGGDGVTRPGYTLREREAHQLFRSWATELGLRVTEDAAGNTIAHVPGVADKPAIATGSHLDSVPGGGRFDGVVGVVAALEAVRLILESGRQFMHPLRVVVFACEEGARFGRACLGSQAIAGLLGTEALDALSDSDGVSLARAMRSVSLLPERLATARWLPGECGAFLELHVEQGQVLELEAVGVGCVDVISGSTRYAIQIDGRATHSGATPMNMRADALAAAAEIVLAAEETGNGEAGHGTRCTVGQLDVSPGNVSTVPGHVMLTLDVRGTDFEWQQQAARLVIQRAESICRQRGVQISVREVAATPPVTLPAWLRNIVVNACDRLDVASKVMTSGASHDAQVMQRITDSALLFVPSEKGISQIGRAHV